MILEDEHSFGLQMMLPLGKVCQNCIIGLIYFAHVVPVLAIILNLLRILLLLMNNGGVMLLLELGVQVVTDHRFLGGFLGSRSEKDEYVMSKVYRWVGYVDVLARAAVT